MQQNALNAPTAPRLISSTTSLKHSIASDGTLWTTFHEGQRMYSVVLALHNLVRWVVIVVGVWAVMRAWRGWLRNLPWTARDHQASRLFVGVLDLQLLVGVLLYVFFSPLTRRAFQDPGAAMRDAPVRYFFVEHMTMMMAAIAIAHVGLARVRREPCHDARFQTASLWLGIALAVIVGFLPWARPLLPVLQSRPYTLETYIGRTDLT
jgi:hypothetical protein